ncbi:MAG TPA: hypothetical protein VFA41_11915 [Ktedonobacteraceae bacterium]|jgi:hypothetical protein|nr:hypothetical protein [Ktedonobacteraceae bacterium]
MATDQKSVESQQARWLRLALMTYTIVAPIIRSFAQRAVKAQEEGEEDREIEIEIVDEDDGSQPASVAMRERLAGLTQQSRDLVAEQVANLRSQSRNLQKQSARLQKALRKEMKQRRKLAKQLRKAGVSWSQDLLKRGEELAEELIERSEKTTQELSERSSKLARKLAKQSSKVAQDLAERGSDVIEEITGRGEDLAQELTKRGNKMTRELQKRGRKASKNLVERGQQLVPSKQKQKFNIWPFVGFGVGLVVAGVVTYRFVRNRLEQQQMLEEEDTIIEIPLNGNVAGNVERPAGEIRRLDHEGPAVATLETVTVQSGARPEGAAYVGVLSTKHYYPVDKTLDATDLVYFPSEEEARAQGFTAAE